MYFTKEGPQVDNKHLKMCLISLYIRKNENSNNNEILWHIYHEDEKSKRLTIANGSEDEEQLELSCMEVLVQIGTITLETV